MSLNELLRGVVFGCDAIGALIMDQDGIVVDEFRSDDLFDLQGCAVEYSAAIRETRHATDLLDGGALEELSIATQRLNIFVRALDEGLVLLLFQPREAVCGKARYLMRRDLHLFRDALR